MGRSLTVFTDKEIKKRYEICYGKDRDFAEGQIPFSRAKWSSLSEFVKEIKLGFSRYYNRRHNRRGFFWGDRFKTVIVENGQALINCLAYIDLNPVRAGIVEKPEEYRWNSIGYHLQTNNKDSFPIRASSAQKNLSPKTTSASSIIFSQKTIKFPNQSPVLTVCIP